MIWLAFGLIGAMVVGGVVAVASLSTTVLGEKIGG